MNVPQLTYGQRNWLQMQISDALRKLGYQITPALVEAEATRLDALEIRTLESTDPPDPYAPQLAKLREQRATPASRFEDAYRLDRHREFDAERNAPTPPDPPAWPAVPPPDTTYAPPDPYASVLKRDSK